MKMSLVEIAQLVGGKIVGSANLEALGLSPIDDVKANTLTFAHNLINLQRAEQSDAAAILVNRSVASSIKTLVQVEHPFQAFITLLNHFYPPQKMPTAIHPTAVIDSSAVLGDNVYIGAFVSIGAKTVIGAHSVVYSHVSIGNNAVVGSHTIIHPHVTIYDACEIGSNAIIHANSVIGADGFGYKWIDGRHVKIPHVGKVVVENCVEIGAHTAIDRATLGATVIGEGTKIDNHVQIAHSVKIGKHNILCAFTGIAGSSRSGDNVVFAANVGVSNGVHIGNNVTLAARTGVATGKHLKDGNVYFGTPARPKEKAIEQELAIARLPSLRKKILELTKKVDLLLKQTLPNETQ